MMQAEGRATITPRALAWLANSRSVRLLLRFDLVCNLVNQEGGVLSLQAPPVGLRPFSWRIERALWSRLDFDRPVQVERATRTLIWGDLPLSAAAAAVWDPRPDWRLLRGRRWPRPDFPIDPALDRLLAGVVGALARRDGALLPRRVAPLAGRGGGLTPAGDDMLMGLIYGMWVLAWDPAWMAAIARAAAPRTTTLSAAFLHSAAAGEAMSEWHAVVTGRPDALERLWAIGHTSGRDGWLGFVTAVERLGEGQ